MAHMKWYHGEDGGSPFVPVRYSLSIHQSAKAHPNYRDNLSVKKPLRQRVIKRVEKVALVTDEQLTEFQRKANERENAVWEWDRRFHGIRPGLSEVV